MPRVGHPACLMIQPTKKTQRAWEDFKQKMNKVAGTTLAEKELLQYCLAFMNSTYAQQRLVTGHRPTPKGSYAITEAYMKEIPIPLPPDKNTAKNIVAMVNALESNDFTIGKKEEEKKMEEQIQELVNVILGGA